MIYAQDYLNCSKIEVLDKTQGVYRCSEYGNNFSGKRVKIENEVKRLFFFDVFMSGWDEVKEVPFEGEKGTVYNYIVYDASFNNGKLDGYVFMNYQPVAYAVRANPKSFYRSNEYKSVSNAADQRSVPPPARWQAQWPHVLCPADYQSKNN